MSHLVIVDGHAIAHRAYHSIPPLTANGQPVNAIYGFYSMILSSIEILKPNYLMVCLDSPGPNFRNQEFIGYRAKRKPADRELVSQLPQLPITLEKAGISHYAMGGFEADDLIATLAVKSLKKKSKLKVTIITGDKDLMQLVGPRISLFVPIRGLSETKIYRAEDVKEKLGVNPNQVVDLKALMGDMSDNYPGVEGIGPVAAIKLLEQYQTLDNIYSHLNEIKPVIKEKLEKGKESAYLSQKLATLVTNIPLKFTLKSARWSKNNFAGLLPLFQEYNFRSLISRATKKFALKSPKLIIKPSPTNQPRLF